MAVTDGTPDSNFAPDGGYPQPKKRNSKHYKAIARAAEKLAADRLTQLEDARAVSETWRNTSTFNGRLFNASVGVALAEAVIIGWLAFWHYKP